MIPKLIAIEYKFNCVKVSNPPDRFNISKNDAYFIVNYPFARGLDFVLSTCISIFRSHMSFTIHPADLIVTDPNQKVITKWATIYAENYINYILVLCTLKWIK